MPARTTRRAQAARIGLVLGLFGPAPALAETAGAVAEDDAVEEMIVIGDAGSEIDVLAGASTIVLDADEGLLEGARLEGKC